MGRIIVIVLALLIWPQGAWAISVPIVDAFGKDSGWTAIVPDDGRTGILVDKVAAGYARIEITKAFVPVNQGGAAANAIQFVRNAGATSAVAQIQITDEIITNNTGVAWSVYHSWIVGEDAAFNRPATDASGFSIDPYSRMTWGATGWDPDHLLSFVWDQGSVADSQTFYPGLDSGRLYIDIDPAASEFTLMQGPDYTVGQPPIPEPLTMLGVGMGTLAACGALRKRIRPTLQHL